MENLGKHLQKLREEKGLSPKQIWTNIRIRVDQIELIENNRLFELGDYGFCKALVYNYARYLEADTNAIMKEFNIMMPDTTKKGFKPSAPVKEKKIMLSTNFLWTIGILIFVLVLSSILYSAYLNGYLQSPNFFRDKEDKTETITKDDSEEALPDTLRERMKMLTESMPKALEPESKTSQKQSKRKPVSTDKTDYVGEQMGDSPINVETD